MKNTAEKQKNRFKIKSKFKKLHKTLNIKYLQSYYFNIVLTIFLIFAD